MSHLVTTHKNLEENSTLKHSEECRQSQAGQYNFIRIKFCHKFIFFFSLSIFKMRVWCGLIIEVGRIRFGLSIQKQHCAVRWRGGGAKFRERTKQFAGAKRTQLRHNRPLWAKRQNGTATRTGCAVLVAVPLLVGIKSSKKEVVLIMMIFVVGSFSSRAVCQKAKTCCSTTEL